ncbi:cytosolic beta-glucosidase isoform X1 [Gadus morhua]|uniref:cytosolic beta-glucosidase isoform X1 n=1 Tax=Gadus morhua TaxID=8049 RepID=UPI0011B6C337|nr:cytosolic beta-glucosidase-like isoform X1 [Gadus morhua]
MRSAHAERKKTRSNRKRASCQTPLQTHPYSSPIKTRSPISGWDADGKGESIWDAFCHRDDSSVFERHTGDVSCNSYHLWEEDLRCIEELGLTHYRLSLSWSRLLPDGTTGHVNQQGVRYYNQVLDGLLARGVTPMVTLYHFDLPQALQDRGGWQSADTPALFDAYARFCFGAFGDRVRLWITLNEPYVCAKLGHEDGLHAPGVRGAAYRAGHHMLRAHALAWHSYDAGYRRAQGGLVSMAINSDWAEPEDADSAEDAAAAARYLAFSLGWFAWPLFVSGDYPEVMRAAVDARLPRFSGVQPAVLGTADFFALNYYTARKVRSVGVDGGAPSMKKDLGAEGVVDPAWPLCGLPWLAVAPHGLRQLLKYIKATFNHPAVYITENGFAQTGPVLMEDGERAAFYRETVGEVAKAIEEDGVDVRGYFAWSLLDNFEWTDGYGARFGLFHVDFSDDERARTMYRSGREYAAIISKHRSRSRAHRELTSS